jgi:hypothetical protein
VGSEDAVLCLGQKVTQGTTGTSERNVMPDGKNCEELCWREWLSFHRASVRANEWRFCCGALLDSNTNSQNLAAPSAASAG